MWLTNLWSRKNKNIERRSRPPWQGSILQVKARVVEKRKQRINKLGAITLLVIALAGLGWATVTGAHLMGDALFVRNDLFTIKNLVMKSNGRLQAHHLKEYTGLSEGQNLFAVNIGEVRRNLLSVPLVKTVEVSRQLPDTLVVQVTERAPLARIGQDDKMLHLAVDEEGYVLGPAARSPNLATIIGISDRGLAPGSTVDGIDEALSLLKLCDTSSLGQTVRVSTIDVRRPEYLDIRLVGGERVLMSRTDLAIKLDKLAEVLRLAADRGQTVQSVDMTVSKNFPVQYREH